MPTPPIATFRRLASRLRLERDWYLVVTAMGIGLLVGGMAAAFILPLRAVERFAAGADRSLLVWLVPTVPIVGALLTGVVTRLFGDVGRGPGVTAVIYSIHRQRSALLLRLGIRKWIASTLTIGSGGSAGAEGPIVTIGAVLGSNVARILGATPQNTATLLGCGAAAGISAVFNAPIAGIFFVMEIMLRDFSLRTFTPIVIASVVSSACAQQMLGAEPIFPVEAGAYFDGQSPFTLMQIPNFLMLGLICGAAAALFVRGLFISEDLFAKLPVPAIVRPACGAVGLAVLGVAFLLVTDHNVPSFYGNGYPVIEQLLEPASYNNSTLARFALLLAALAVVKGVATCFTIGSGGAGGLFAPSLLMGAAVGGAFGLIVNGLGWFPAANPACYALVGMGAMVAGTTHAPLTGILIVYEITRDYQTILPLMLAAVIATIVGRLAYRDSVYTVRLRKLGVRLGAMSDLTILRRLSVRDVQLIEGVHVGMHESAQRLLDISEQRHVTDFIVVDDHNTYCGLVTGDDLKAALVYREAIPLLQVSELVRSDLPTVAPGDTLDVVLDKFARHDIHSLAVLREGGSGEVLGMITRARLMRRYQDALDED